ncbi:PQQ-binding-like beta-propeller repeat protein [Streptomyces sp. NPDC015346]|uniref:outer membrane protein assembly factor BamB family protein n=1 Tax=Streptomyces sp. NPDC015346 TaxID=3364954 RepID=UPI0036FC5805
MTGAADVFSLGAVLVFAATGRRAFTGPHVAAVQYAVVHAQPDLGSLSPQLAALVAPCLAKDAALRPSPAQIARAFSPSKSARTLWRQGSVFQEIKRRESAVRRQTASAETSVERLPGRRRFLAWGLGAAVLLGGGGASAWWLTERAANALPPAGDAPDAALLKAEDERIEPEPLWGPVEAAAHGPLPTPVVLRDVVIFAARNGGLTALKVTDGTQKWTLPHLSARARQLAVDEDHFAAADEGGRLFFIEASTSAEKWTLADADVAMLLAADPGAIYLLTKKGKLRAVDTAGRTVRWTGPSVRTTEDDTGPLAAAGRNRLVLSLPSGNVSAVDTTTGRSVWEIRGQGTTALQPLVDGDTVYLGGRTLTAVSLVEGRRLWAADANSKPEGTEGGWGPPALDGDGVVAADGPFVYRFSTSGTRDSALFAGLNGTRSPLTPPVIQGNCIWVIEGLPEFGVSALSKPSDERVWTYEREDRGPWTMTGAGNRVFLISRGKVVAMPVF